MVKLSLNIYHVGDKLTKKQMLWIDEYIKTDDLTTASRNAGYKSKDSDGLRHIGYENSIRFKEIIDHRRNELNEKITNKNIASLEDIQLFWTNIFNDPDSKLADRLKASELLGKSKGAFIERREVKEVTTDWFIDNE